MHRDVSDYQPKGPHLCVYQFGTHFFSYLFADSFPFIIIFSSSTKLQLLFSKFNFFSFTNFILLFFCLFVNLISIFKQQPWDSRKAILSCYSLFRALFRFLRFSLLECYCFVLNAIFHFLLQITISFLFLLLLSFTFLLHLRFYFIYVSAFSFICVFCLNLWKARFSGVVSL